MDVSWKRKKTINGTNGGGVNLVAELVGNYHAAGNTEGNITTQLGIIGEKFLNSKIKLPYIETARAAKNRVYYFRNGSKTR
jgi:hypothetical protein